jgi:hypothetical protein
MKVHKILLIIAAIVLTVGVANAQVKQLISEEQLTELLGRIDTSTNNFAMVADKAMDKQGMDGSTREDDLNKNLANFKKATAALRADHTGAAAKSNFETVLHHGVAIENFLKRNPLDGVTAEWTTLRSDLGELAKGFNITWDQGHALGAKVGKSDLKNLFDHIDEMTGAYKKSVDSALDASPLNGTKTEDEINGYIKDFKKSTDTLEDHHNDASAPDNAKDVLLKAKRIDDFHKKHALTPDVQNAWATVRVDLERLAIYYQVAPIQ